MNRKRPLKSLLRSNKPVEEHDPIIFIRDRKPNFSKKYKPDFKIEWHCKMCKDHYSNKKGDK